jgi:hypothetical protein
MMDPGNDKGRPRQGALVQIASSTKERAFRTTKHDRPHLVFSAGLLELVRLGAAELTAGGGTARMSTLHDAPSDQPAFVPLDRDALAAALGELPGIAAALRRLAEAIDDRSARDSLAFAVSHVSTALRRVQALSEGRT